MSSDTCYPCLRYVHPSQREGKIPPGNGVLDNPKENAARCCERRRACFVCLAGTPEACVPIHLVSNSHTKAAAVIVVVIVVHREDQTAIHRHAGTEITSDQVRRTQTTVNITDVGD